MITGQKHIIMCRCILPQFRKLQSPPQHQFIVFSIIGEDGNVISHHAQCNNCGIIHKVTDICRSDVVHGKEASAALITKDDLKLSLPEKLVTILELNNAELPSWQAVQFILENKNWGEFVVLSEESDGDSKQGKYLRILGESLYKIESFTRSEVVK